MDPSQQELTQQQQHNPEYLTAYPLPSTQRRYSPSPSSTSPNPQYIHLVPHANLTIPSTLSPGPSAHYTTTAMTSTLSSSYAHMSGREPHHPHQHHHTPQYGASLGTTHPSVSGYLPTYANMPLMPLSLLEPTLTLDTMGMSIPAAVQQPQTQQQHRAGGGGELQLPEDRQSRQADTLTSDAGGSTREGGGERGTSAESGDSSSGVRRGGNRRGSGSTIFGAGGGRGVGKKTRGRPRMDSNDENAADRRRTQIRLAQRAYRMRKETTITSLRSRVEALEKQAEEMQTLFHELYDAALNHHQLDPGVYRESISQLSDRFQALQAPSVAAGSDVGAESTHDEAEQENLELITSTPSLGLNRRTSGDDDDGSGSSAEIYQHNVGTLSSC